MLLLSGISIQCGARQQEMSDGHQSGSDPPQSVAEVAMGECKQVVKETRAQWQARVANQVGLRCLTTPSHAYTVRELFQLKLQTMYSIYSQRIHLPPLHVDLRV